MGSSGHHSICRVLLQNTITLHASQLLLKLLKEVSNYPNGICTNLQLGATNLMDATITIILGPAITMHKLH